MGCGGADIAKVVGAIEGDGGTKRVRHVAVSCTEKVPQSGLDKQRSHATQRLHTIAERYGAL